MTREKALSSMSRKIDGDFLITVPGNDLGNRAFAELRVEDALYRRYRSARLGLTRTGAETGDENDRVVDLARSSSRPVPDAANV